MEKCSILFESKGNEQTPSLDIKAISETDVVKAVCLIVGAVRERLESDKNKLKLYDTSIINQLESENNE